MYKELITLAKINENDNSPRLTSQEKVEQFYQYMEETTPQGWDRLEETSILYLLDNYTN